MEADQSAADRPNMNVRFILCVSLLAAVAPLAQAEDASSGVAARRAIATSATHVHHRVIAKKKHKKHRHHQPPTTS
jgi:hypothetical protein